jgi:hypothetical protein
MRQGNRRNHRRYSLARLLIIAGIALLAASVMLKRMLRPLHWRPYSHASRIALPANSAAPADRQLSPALLAEEMDVRAADASEGVRLKEFKRRAL